MIPMIITEVVEKRKLPEHLQQLCEQHKSDFIRKSIIIDKASEFKEGERAEITYVSTVDMDRDQEVLLPSGCDLREFKKAPQVLWGHEYKNPPIGSDSPELGGWIKTDKKGILAKTVYADTVFAEDIWKLIKAGHLKTSSVGFIPIKWLNRNDEGWGRLIDKLAKQGIRVDREKCRRIYTKWILLEHSKVSVSANINALTQSVAKAVADGEFELQLETLEELGLESIKTEQLKKQAGIKIKDLLEELGIDRAKLEEEEQELQRLMDLFFPNLQEQTDADIAAGLYDENGDELSTLKPFPNEHSCRLHPPDRYSRFRRNNNRFGDGIHAIFGRRKTDGKSELQAIRFDKTKFTVAQAKKWCKDHKHTCKPFEPATDQGKDVVIICESCEPEPQPTIVEVIENPDKLKQETVKALNRAIGKV